MKHVFLFHLGAKLQHLGSFVKRELLRIDSPLITQISHFYLITVKPEFCLHVLAFDSLTSAIELN